ncbi:MAG TPA: hypothetical protein VFA33_07880 [Bryobacteraceae bacterium]|nr:hypothetical protein [Bryobacteraceae bacterium]
MGGKPREKSKENPAAALRKLLRAQTRAAREEALRNGGQVPAEQVESLRRLRQLAEFSRAVEAPERRRWPILAMLLATLAIASVLFFSRLRRTEIEMDVNVSEVSFRLGQARVISDTMGVASVGASGFKSIEAPGMPVSEGSMLIQAAKDGDRSGLVSLAPIALPASTRVTLERGRDARRFRLSLAGPGAELRCDAIGPVEIAAAGSPKQRLNLPMPRGIALRTGADEADLEITLPGAEAGRFLAQIPAEEISMFRIDQHVTSGLSIVHRASTILGGSIFFESLDGLERKLRPAEGLRFASARGEIRSLGLDDRGISFRFHGEVEGMSTGAGEDRRSLMPTWLEWLRARHGLPLLWGSALYLFTLATAALRWWGVRL